MYRNRFVHHSTRAHAISLPWGTRAFQIIVMGLLAMLVLTYIAITNSVATQGYKLSEIQQQLDNIKRQNADVELAITAAQSLPRVEAEAGAISLAPIVHVEYLA